SVIGWSGAKDFGLEPISVAALTQRCRLGFLAAHDPPGLHRLGDLEGVQDLLFRQYLNPGRLIARPLLGVRRFRGDLHRDLRLHPSSFEQVPNWRELKDFLDSSQPEAPWRRDPRAPLGRPPPQSTVRLPRNPGPTAPRSPRAESVRRSLSRSTPSYGSGRKSGTTPDRTTSARARAGLLRSWDCAGEQSIRLGTMSPPSSR